MKTHAMLGPSTHNTLSNEGFCLHQMTTPSSLKLVELSNKMFDFPANNGEREKTSFG